MGREGLLGEMRERRGVRCKPKKDICPQYVRQTSHEGHVSHEGYMSFSSIKKLQGLKNRDSNKTSLNFDE